MDHLDKREHNHLDFSEIREVSTKPKFPLRRFFSLTGKVVLWYLAINLFLLLIVGIFYGARMKSIYSRAQEIKTSLESVQHQAVNRDFAGAAVTLESSKEKIDSVQKDFSSIPFVRWMPGVRAQVIAVDHLLLAAANLTTSGTQVLNLADDLTKKIRNESIPYAQLRPEQKKDIVARLVAAEPMFKEVSVELHQADDAIASIQKGFLIKQLRDVVEPLQRYMPLLTSMVDRAIPMLSIAPQVVGFDGPKTYLFLIQNNRELRPTGGFIGTYGLLKLDSGEIVDFKTDNIYNLDKAFSGEEGVKTPQQLVAYPSPMPIARWLEQKDLALRDSNWNPDFPTSAKLAVDLYQAESQVASQTEKEIYLRDRTHKAKNFVSSFQLEDVDGVIAITPEVIEGLLKITGAITVDGVRFTTDNFQDELERRVTHEFLALGIAESDRKEIIRKLADQIKVRILSLPYTRLADVFDVAASSLTAKSILMYSMDPNLQKLIVERGWAGEVQSVDHDYLYVVNSNLGSLKSDQFIKRTISYSLEKKDGKYLATATVTHQHQGEFAWNSTRLRSYTRFYAPLGSKLVSSNGQMYDDKSRNPDNKPGTVDTFAEDGKTVFGAFFAVEPKETGSLSVIYELPQNVADLIDAGVYNLFVQKQPGAFSELTVSLNFGKTIGAAQPAGELDLLKRDYSLTQPLDTDKSFVLKF